MILIEGKLIAMNFAKKTDENNFVCKFLKKDIL